MKHILRVILLMVFVGFQSCEDQLDIKNPNQPTSDTFFKNMDDAVKSVNAIYSRLNGPSIERQGLWLGNLRSDEMKSTSPAIAIVNNFDLFAISNYNIGQFLGIWSNLYVIIYRANQTLDNVPGIEISNNTEDQALKDRILGEAKFLRGWAYYQLALYWGNIPMLLQTSNPTDKPSSSTQEEVYNQIITDFQFAFDKLWTKNDYKSNKPEQNIGRATKGAAKAMLAKTLMQMGKYSDALKELEWLVEGGGASYYALVPDFRDNFLLSTENNSESVFELQSERNEANAHKNDINDPDQYNYGNDCPKFYAPRINGIGFADLEMNRWVLVELQKEKTPGGDRDPRIAASFLFDSTDILGPKFTMVYGETWLTRFPNPAAESHKRVSLRKFLNDATQNTEDFSSGNNYRYLRYADILLLYAECLNATGRTNDAYQWVNKVRLRSGLSTLQEAHPEIGSNKDLFLEQLKHERITELAGEAHRWSDLVRWGDLSPDLKVRDKGFANFQVGKHEFLPINQADLDFNPNLSQNPNW